MNMAGNWCRMDELSMDEKRLEKCVEMNKEWMNNG